MLVQNSAVFGAVPCQAIYRVNFLHAVQAVSCYFRQSSLWQLTLNPGRWPLPPMGVRVDGGHIIAQY